MCWKSKRKKHADIYWPSSKSTKPHEPESQECFQVCLLARSQPTFFYVYVQSKASSSGTPDLTVVLSLPFSTASDFEYNTSARSLDRFCFVNGSSAHSKNSGFPFSINLIYLLTSTYICECEGESCFICDELAEEYRWLPSNEREMK